MDKKKNEKIVKKMRILYFVMFLFIIVLQFLSAKNIEKGLILENSYVRFEFEKGTLGLAAMIDKTSGINHIIDIGKPHLLFEAKFKKGLQGSKLNNLKVKATKAFIERKEDGTQIAILQWDDITWWREKGAMSVKIMIELPPNSGIAQWRITIDNKSDIWGMWSVKFPYFNGLMESGKYDIAVPYANGGQLLKNCAQRISERQYPSQRWPSQFLCASKGLNSIYVAALDPGSRRKDYVFKPGSEFYFIHYAENMAVPGSDYEDYFPIAIGVYQGGWITAAKMYKKWALKQRWMEMGPISQRTDMPDIIKNTALWWQSGWNFKYADEYAFEFAKGKGGKVESHHEMNEPILEDNKILDVPMAMQWYNWHQNRFDNEYPHFLPPKVGFKARVKELVDSGMLVMPYINGLIVDFDNHDFNKFFPYTVKDQAGIPPMHYYDSTSARLAPMCPTNQFWTNTIAGLVDTLVNVYGVNGVYIDQIAAHTPEFCFDKSHGHPLGSGRWYVDGYQKFLSKMKAIASPKGAIITTENTAEPYMNKIDGFLSWYRPTDEDIPMLQMIYSGYTIYFGGRVANSPKTTDRAFIMAEGRFFIWGFQPGWMPPWFMQPGHEKKAEYFKEIGKYRTATRKFLTYGELLDLIEPLNEMPNISEVWIDQWGVERNANIPGVMGAVWKSEKGELGVYLVNLDNKEHKISYKIDTQKYGLNLSPNKKFILKRITPEKVSVEGENNEKVITRVEILKPYEIKVLEISE